MEAADCAEDPTATTLFAVDVREDALEEEDGSMVTDTLLDDDRDEEEGTMVNELLDLEVDELDRTEEEDVLLLCEEDGTEDDGGIEEDDRLELGNPNGLAEAEDSWTALLEVEELLDVLDDDEDGFSWHRSSSLLRPGR